MICYHPYADRQMLTPDIQWCPWCRESRVFKGEVWLPIIKDQPRRSKT